MKNLHGSDLSESEGGGQIRLMTLQGHSQHLRKIEVQKWNVYKAHGNVWNAFVTKHTHLGTNSSS